MRAKTSIGLRRLRFLLQQSVETPDAAGGVVRSFATLMPVWGTLESVSGDERWRSGRSEQAVSHRIHLRYREGISGLMRFLLGERVFDVRSTLDPDGRRTSLICLVEEIKP